MRSTLFIVLTVGLASPALADNVDFELRNTVMKGRDKPALIMVVNKAIKDARLELTAVGGKPIVKRSGRLRAGKTFEFVIDAPVGVTSYAGKVAVTYSDGTNVSMPLTFNVEVAAGFRIDVPKSTVNVSAGELLLTLTRPAGYCDHEVIFDDKPSQRGRTEYSGEAPGTPLPLSWTTYTANDLTLKITLTCFDRGGFFDTGYELYPWELSVPHDDVVFDSGQSAIKSSESHKVETAFAEIDSAVRRYGKWVSGVKLFVGGHTDTVGTPDYNRGLSLLRARAIAQLFKRLGVTVPIYYAGFGEDQLRVQTPDETPQEANRRADYVIRPTMPASSGWKRL